jgi:hypothetical protein
MDKLLLIAGLFLLAGCTPPPQPVADVPDPVEQPVKKHIAVKKPDDQPSLQKPADQEPELNEPREYHANSTDDQFVIEK